MYAIVLFIFNEGQAYIMYSDKYKKMGYCEKLPVFGKSETFSSYYSKLDKDIFFKESLVGKNYNDKPIIIFGGKLANSALLPKEKNLGSLISKSTQRPVYNFARPTWTYSHMFYMLKNEEKLSSINDVDTIILFFEPEQFVLSNYEVFYPHQNYLNLNYVIKNESLIEKIPHFPFIYASYYIKLMRQKQLLAYSFKHKNNVDISALKTFEYILLESMKMAKIKYPNLKKFIIFRYVPSVFSIDNLKKDDKNADIVDMWFNIKKAGFTILDLPNVIKEEVISVDKYNLPDNSPKEDILQIITQNFIIETGL